MVQVLESRPVLAASKMSTVQLTTTANPENWPHMNTRNTSRMGFQLRDSLRIQLHIHMNLIVQLFMAYYKYVQQVMAGSISNVMVAMRCRNSRGRSCIRDPFFRNLTVAMRKSNLFQSVSSTLQSFDQDEERQLCKTTRFSITHASSSIHRSIDSEYRKTCVRNTPC